MMTHSRSNATNGGTASSAPASSCCTPASHEVFAAATAGGAALPRNSTLMNGWMRAIHSVDVSE